VSSSSHRASAILDYPRPVVFYDGACPLCRREIAHYRRVDHAGRLRWVDAAGEVHTLAGFGLSLEDAMAELHVLDAAGAWQRGVDAFVVIWEHLPRYRWLARLVSALGLRGPLGFAYQRFAAWRYRRRCSADGCAAANGARRQ
jgi:predicted DCC family thiol-disulfide oxidoreductase YuxK